MKKLAADVRADPSVINVVYQSPTFRMDLMARLVGKIACGFLFAVAPASLKASNLGNFVVDGGDVQRQQSFVFSASNDVFPMGNNEVRAFEVREASADYIYIAVRLLPEALDENYMVRIAKSDTEAVEQTSWNYSDQ